MQRPGVAARPEDVTIAARDRYALSGNPPVDELGVFPRPPFSFPFVNDSFNFFGGVAPCDAIWATGVGGQQLHSRETPWLAGGAFQPYVPWLASRPSDQRRGE